MSTKATKKPLVFASACWELKSRVVGTAPSGAVRLDALKLFFTNVLPR